MLSGLTPVEEVKEEGFGEDKGEKLGYASVPANTSTNPQGAPKLEKTQELFQLIARTLALHTAVSDQSWTKVAPGKGCGLIIAFGFIILDVMNVQNSLVQ